MKKRYISILVALVVASTNAIPFTNPLTVNAIASIFGDIKCVE